MLYIKNAHGRLISTKHEYLKDWKDGFNRMTTFKEDQDAFGKIYIDMVDHTIDGVDIKYTEILEQCEKRVVNVAKQKVDNASLNEIKYREA